MVLLELVCVAIVATYVAARLLRADADADGKRSPLGGGRAAFLVRFAALSVASFLGENSVIRAYGYYAYAPGWTVRVDQVPLVIVLVWPVVIDSAATLARAIIGARGADAARGSSPRLRIALLGAAIVLADASLIEPIAVRADLWHWTQPGLFAVPPVGIVGWALFSLCAILILESGRPLGVRVLLLVALAPIATHGLIVATWWLFFRWVQGERSGALAAGVAWGLSIAIALGIARARDAQVRRVPAIELLLRLPGAAFFFVLLASGASPPPPLLFFAVAFAPPYLIAFARIARTRRPRCEAGATSILD